MYLMIEIINSLIIKVPFQSVTFDVRQKCTDELGSRLKAQSPLSVN